MLCRQLQPTPVGVNLTLVKWFLHNPDLASLLQQAQRTGQKSLTRVHHESEEIHQVL